MSNENETSAEELIALPRLVGTEKQVRWARDLRDKRVAQVVNFLNPDKPWPHEWETTFVPTDTDDKKTRRIQIVNALLSIDSAHWWIETRFNGLRSVLLEACDRFNFIEAHAPSDEAVKEAANEVKQEAVLAPPMPHGPVVEIGTYIVWDAQIFAVPDHYDQAITDFLKKRGFKFQSTTSEGLWSRNVNEKFIHDRAVETAVLLMAEGFAVRVFDDVLRQKVIKQEYVPEVSRQIKVSHHYKWGTRFHIDWRMDSDAEACKKAAAELKGAKVFDDGAYIPPSYYEELQDFAEEFDFEIDPNSEKLIADQKAIRDKAIGITPKPKKFVQAKQQMVVTPGGAIHADLADD